MNELQESVMLAMSRLSPAWPTVDEIVAEIGAHRSFVSLYERALWGLRDLGLVEWNRRARSEARVRFTLSNAGWGWLDSGAAA